MAENKMKEVAQLVGLELEEEFRMDNYSTKYKLTKNGFMYWSDDYQQWNYSGGIEELFLGKSKIVKIPILDEKEKEYLSSVIKPFRDRISYIVKCNKLYGEYIEIDLRCYSDETDERTMLPFFERGTLYKSMATNRRYTLEELGL